MTAEQLEREFAPADPKARAGHAPLQAHENVTEVRRRPGLSSQPLQHGAPPLQPTEFQANPNGAAALRRAGKGGVALREALRQNAKEHAMALAPVVAEIRTEEHTSLRAMAEALNTRDMMTRRGGPSRSEQCTWGAAFHD